jgi:secreted trypsin-like serine protease
MTRSMSRACLAAALALLACGGASAQARALLGLRSFAHAAVIGGGPVAGGAFPSLAEVLDERGAVIGQCTGTVIAPTLILTAGHCAENVKTGAHNPPGGYSVLTYAGASGESKQQLSRVTATLVYEGFKRRNDDADAALLVLSAPVSAPAVQLAGSITDPKPRAGTLGRIVGWGRTRFQQSRPTQSLHAAATVLQAASWCARNAPPFFKRSELCAIDPPSYASGGCNGDSGGPLLVGTGAAAVEVGIAVHVYARCSTRRPTVFTSVAAIHAWLESWVTAYAIPAGAPSPTPAATPST